MSKKVRLGFVGCGYMGQLAHISNYAMIPDCELVALAEGRQNTAKAVANKYGIANVYSDHREMLEKAELDGVVAIMWYTLYHSVVPDIINAGLPLATEKPMCVSSETSKRMVEYADKKGVLYQIGYMKRHDPAAKLARETIGLVESMGVPFANRPDAMTADDIEANLRWFGVKSRMGVLDMDELWKFWDKDTFRSRLFSILSAVDQLVRRAVKEDTDRVRWEAGFALDFVKAACSKHEIRIDKPPRSLLSLLSSDIPDDVQASILQILLALRATLPIPLILNHLDLAKGAKLYGICEYIEYAGIVVDEELKAKLLEVVESEDDSRFFFIATDDDRNEVEVDVREYAARCLMLTDEDDPTREELLKRIASYYPDIVDMEFSITLDSLIRDAVYGRDSADKVFLLGKPRGIPRSDKVDN